MSKSAARRRPLLIEMASIVVAVILGFVVTSWDEGRRERQRAQEAVERIRLELQANLESFESVSPYYQEVVQSLVSVLQEAGDVGLDERPIPGWRGVNPPRIRTASYSVAKSTGALEHVDYAIADQIATAYESIDHFETAFDQAIAATMSGNVRTLSEWALVLSLLREVAEGAEISIAATLEEIAGS